MTIKPMDKKLSDDRVKPQYLLAVFVLLPLLIFTALWSWYQLEGVRWQFLWVPSLDVNLSFRLDGLSFLFAALISGIGALVQIYALAYLRGKPSRFSFHLYLTLFMLAMLGVVTSDNILLLFVFWELTTITSYLLIGFNHDSKKSRTNALQSLIVTGAGGLALLAGLILLGMVAGSYELSVIIERSALIRQHSLFVPTLVLILLGAFTKSAQFPFHFWLPNAMAAPTPVSAYLHSATMVKAGIYLLARLSPVYSESDIWFYTLGIAGGFTAIWCAILALKQTDIKLMLAYSTNVALGKLVLLLGIGTELALTAAFLFIVTHSFYKAALFMVIGNIDKATGTREIGVLRGLKSVLLLSLVAATVAALSKSGVPPLLGFVSKEYMYKASLEISSWATVTFIVANAFMVATALVLVIKPFLAHHDGDPTPAKPVEMDKGLWVPPMLLSIGSFLVPVMGLGWLSSHVVIPSVLSAAPNADPQAVKLWQGLNLPLLLSAVTLLLGYLLYKVYPSMLARWKRMSMVIPSANHVFDLVMGGMMSLAHWQTQLLQQKRLSVYVLLFFSVLAGVFISHPIFIHQHLFFELSKVTFYEVAMALFLVAAAVLCTFSRSRLLSIAALGVVGFMTTLVFMLYSAPDVAKTLLLVETLMMVFVVLLVGHLPRLKTVPTHSVLRRLAHGVIAIVIGFSVTAILINITSQPMDTTLADFFAENSLPGGHGRNIVNVILVDFRAFDTLGEVMVVVIAALSAVSLLQTHNRQQNRIHSLIFRTTSHIVAALMLVFSFYLLLRGHNAPGGGFIGALIAVIGLALLMFAESPSYVQERLHYAPFSIALFGISLSLMAGGLSFAYDVPFLTGLWWKDILPIGTPLVFDVGIYLAIIGGVMGMLLRVNEELD